MTGRMLRNLSALTKLFDEFLFLFRFALPVFSPFDVCQLAGILSKTCISRGVDRPAGWDFYLQYIQQALDAQLAKYFRRMGLAC
jgi:hypothetical protein